VVVYCALEYIFMATAESLEKRPLVQDLDIYYQPDAIRHGFWRVMGQMDSALGSLESDGWVCKDWGLPPGYPLSDYYWKSTDLGGQTTYESSLNGPVGSRNVFALSTKGKALRGTEALEALFSDYPSGDQNLHIIFPVHGENEQLRLFVMSEGKMQDVTEDMEIVGSTFTYSSVHGFEVDIACGSGRTGDFQFIVKSHPAIQMRSRRIPQHLVGEALNMVGVEITAERLSWIMKRQLGIKGFDTRVLLDYATERAVVVQKETPALSALFRLPDELDSTLRGHTGRHAISHPGLAKAWRLAETMVPEYLWRDIPIPKGKIDGLNDYAIFFPFHRDRMYQNHALWEVMIKRGRIRQRMTHHHLVVAVPYTGVSAVQVGEDARWQLYVFDFATRRLKKAQDYQEDGQVVSRYGDARTDGIGYRLAPNQSLGAANLRIEANGGKVGSFIDSRRAPHFVVRKLFEIESITQKLDGGWEGPVPSALAAQFWDQLLEKQSS
jgi:hypothetical protein